MRTTLKLAGLGFAALMTTVLGLAPAALAQNAQTNSQTYKVGPAPVMTLNGTSTMHDWTMTAKSFSGSAQIALAPDNTLAGLNGLTIVLPVKNLKGSKDGLNDNAYEALDADKYKEITFRMKNAKVTPTADKKYQIVAQGDLTIAGNTRPITLTTLAVLNSDGSLTCTGSLPLKMSDFNIERPSFMFGTMKVGDALKLDYSLVLVK